MESMYAMLSQGKFEIILALNEINTILMMTYYFLSTLLNYYAKYKSAYHTTIILYT